MLVPIVASRKKGNHLKIRKLNLSISIFEKPICCVKLKFSMYFVEILFHSEKCVTFGKKNVNHSKLLRIKSYATSQLLRIRNPFHNLVSAF